MLKTDEEIAEDTRKILRGEPVDGESVNEVKDMPEGFKEWEKKNEERMKAAKEAGTLPRFVRENEKVVSEVKQAATNTPVKGVPVSVEQQRSTDIHDLKDTSLPFRGDEPGLPPHIETYTKEAEHVFVSMLNREKELSENVRMAIFLAEKTDEDVFVMPYFQPSHPASRKLRKEFFPEGVKKDKNPDLYFRGRFVDAKCMGNDPGEKKLAKRNIQNRLRDAFKQADDAYLEIPTSYPLGWIEGAIKGKLKSSLNYHVVYVKYGDRLIILEGKK